MSLTDPTSKMSKSHANEFSRIDLTDSNTMISQKIKRAVTDSEMALSWDPVNRPGVANLISIYAACIGENDPANLLCSGGPLHGVTGMARLKEKVTEVVIDRVSPIRDEYLRLQNNLSYVDEVLMRGNQDASLIAEETWKCVADVIGVA
jgi:tryptophanyl-tRNA synthetase